MLRCIKDTLLHKKKAVVTTPPAENQSTITNSNNSNSNTPTELPPPYQRYPLPPTSVPSTISSHSAEQLQHPPRPHQRPYPLPPTSVPSTVSTLSEQHQDQELDQVHPVAQETVNEPPTPTPDTSVPDPFTPKYVPYIDASPLKNNMFARNAGIYGRVNPDIMGGFGDDDNESVWLVDDEENQQHDSSSRPTSSANRPAQSNSRLSGPLSSHDSVAAQAQEPGPAPSSNAEPAFRYQRPSLLDDHDFTSDLLPSTTAVRKTPPSQDTTPAPRRGYAPVAASILNLGELGVEITDIPTSNSEDGTRLSNSRPQPAITSSASSSFANPYVALFEQQDDAMTIAYLRRLEQPGNEAADDFRFGQRYQKASDSSDVVITHQRTPRSDVVGDIECIVCADTKDADAFPRFSVTATCTHPPSTCLDCVQLSIESDLNGKLWTELRCPECRELLEYADIQRYANKQTFTRYETLALRAAMSEAENFIWCTSGCGSGQIHESGPAQPIVTCLHCNHRSCFHHNVAWHETLSCEEYDQLLADPDNFRSRLELENERWSEAREAQLEADRAIAQGLLAEDLAELRRREERERQERERAQKAAKLARQVAARRKKEEDRSKATVDRTTKPCAGCGWAIEKNRGCSHMTCIKCRHEFCWGCNQPWVPGHSTNCRGGRRIKCKHEFCFECGANHRDIMRSDNSVHKKTCPYHPDNLKG